MKLEFLRPLIKYLPEVKLPGRHVPFKEKLIWTSAALILFFIMGVVYPYGVTPEKLQETIRGFEQMQMIFASSMGSIISAGIGPIVTASIILQLMTGAEMLDIDLTKPEGKALFQGTQKILTVIIAFFEAGALVVFTHMVDAAVEMPGGVVWEVSWPLRVFTIFQIALGSILLMYMDEVVSKWGVGSGISLFIAGGVSQTIITGALNPLRAETGLFHGIIFNFFDQMTTKGNFSPVLLFPLIATIIIFLVVVFSESMRIEVPLSYGGIRGVGGRYPIRFFYVSNIPVILAAALLMNLRMWGGFFGVDIQDPPPLEEMTLLQNIVFKILSYTQLRELYGVISPEKWVMLLNPQVLFHLAVYIIIFVALCVLFGKFWVSTTGLDSESVAKQIQEGGMQIPGFRRDRRVVKRVLDRYIPQITIISSIGVGLVAAGADLMGAIGSGTGILLTVGIFYRMYEEIQREQMADMHPMFRRFMGKG